MQRIVAPCGLICSECEAYRATQANDADAVAAIAVEWSRRYGTAFSIEDIWCDACTSAGERTARHTRECPIRPCARRHSIATCAGCGDYPCKWLIGVHRLAPEARETLEAIRRGEA